MHVTIGQIWKHYNGNRYTVLNIANEHTADDKKDAYPITITYRGENGNVWSKSLADWDRSMTLEEPESREYPSHTLTEIRNTFESLNGETAKLPSGHYAYPIDHYKWLGFQLGFLHSSNSPLHTDDLAVNTFAGDMKRKLYLARFKGKSGWDDPLQCPADYLAELMLRSVQNGDMVDVANYAMMLHHHDSGHVVKDKLIKTLTEARTPETYHHSYGENPNTLMKE